MVTRGPVSIERLLPPLHGQSAKIITYLATSGAVTPEQIIKELKVPRSTVYKLLRDLNQMGLVKSIKTGKTERVSVPDFSISLKRLWGIDNLEITPQNVVAFDAAHTSAGRMFIERHGLSKFGRFVKLYEEYEKGKMPAFLIAKELGVTRYEIELLIDDTLSLLQKKQK